VTFDVAVVGAPCLDLTFEGLPRLPRIGEELTGRALHVGLGGAGMHAIAAARLRLATVLVAPLGAGGAAAIARSILDREGVRVRPEATDGADALPTTALLATSTGVAMATVLAGVEPRAEDVVEVRAGAVVMSLGRLQLAPPEGAVFAVTGGLELPSVDDAMLARLRRARALIANAHEAAALTGLPDPTDAALALARRVPIAIVTMGAEGAVAARGSSAVAVDAPRVDVADATGAGDLFAAAYVWADLHDASLQERLAWASLYAGLSVRAPTAFAGALGLDALIEEGIRRGLVPPAGLTGR